MVYLLVFVLILIMAGSVFITIRAHKKTEQKEQRAQEARVRRDDMSCTCDEWRNVRSQFAEGDPRRLCAHCCLFLEKDIMRVPQPYLPFLQLIHHAVAEGRGIPCQQPSFAFVLSDCGYLVLLPTGNNADAKICMGEQDFVLDVYTGEWGSSRPPFAEEIASLIKAEMRRRQKSAANAPRAPLPAAFAEKTADDTRKPEEKPATTQESKSAEKQTPPSQEKKQEKKPEPEAEKPLSDEEFIL